MHAVVMVAGAMREAGGGVRSIVAEVGGGAGDGIAECVQDIAAVVPRHSDGVLEILRNRGEIESRRASPAEETVLEAAAVRSRRFALQAAEHRDGRRARRAAQHLPARNPILYDAFERWIGGAVGIDVLFVEIWSLYVVHWQPRMQ